MKTRPWSLTVRISVACMALVLGACGDKSPQGQLAAGREAYAKKDYKAAAIHFKTALQSDPNEAEARYMLGQTLLDAGDPTSAVDELSKAQTLKYAPEKVTPALVQALLQAGDTKRIITQYADTTFSDATATAQLKTALATTWAALGNPEKADAALKAALAAVPDFGPARLLEARAALGRGDLPGAQALAERILATNAGLADAWMLKGEIQALGRDDAGADASFHKALELNPGYVPAHMMLLGRALRVGDIASAKAQFEKLKASAPRGPATAYAEAQIAFAENHLPRARELAQQLMRVAPDDASVLILAGTVEGRIGSAVLAETYFNKALQIDPGQNTARLNLGLIYMSLGQPAKALAAVQQLLTGPAETAQAHAIAGDAEFKQGNVAAAEEHFKRAASMAPTDSHMAVAVALSGSARNDPQVVFAELQSLSNKSKDVAADRAIVSAHLRRGEYDAALQAVEVMARKQPTDSTIPELRGQILQARQDYPAARAAFEQALKLNPTQYSVIASLASIDILEQKPDAARKRYEATIAADPQNYYARMALAALQKRTGAPLDAVKATLAAAIKASPDAASPRLMLIDLLLRARQNKEALGQARDAAATLPNDVAVLGEVGRAQAQTGEIEQALNTYRRLTNLLPNSAAPLVRLAEIYRSSARNDAAETALRKAIEVEPRSASAQAALIDFMLATKRGNDALQFARQQQRQFPQEETGYLFEGLVQLQLKAPEAAVAAYRKGLAAVGYSSELARALYRAQVTSGKGADAERFAAGWLKEHPDDYALDYQVAVTEVTRGEFALAERRLNRIVAKLPDNSYVMNTLSWVLTQQGKPGGVDYAQRAVNARPNEPEYLDTLAAALAADKQYPRAVQTQQLAIDLAPSNDEFHLNLARIALQAGDKALARRELEGLKSRGAGYAHQDEVAKLLGSL